MKGIPSVQLDTALGSNSAAAARGATEQAAVPSEEGEGRLIDDVTRYFFNYLNPTELVKMSEVDKRVKLTINNDHHLNNRMQHGKYLRLAKQSADHIEDVYERSKAYCAIATEQAKINPEEAKQTADHIQDVYWKLEAYCAISSP